MDLSHPQHWHHTPSFKRKWKLKSSSIWEVSSWLNYQKGLGMGQKNVINYPFPERCKKSLTKRGGTQIRFLQFCLHCWRTWTHLSNEPREPVTGGLFCFSLECSWRATALTSPPPPPKLQPLHPTKLPCTSRGGASPVCYLAGLVCAHLPSLTQEGLGGMAQSFLKASSFFFESRYLRVGY